MNDFIKKLSIDDKKTLSQKMLKMMEEVGELSRKVLPFDQAYGTLHRFVDKESILEELADVYLTNISILYSLGLSDDEFKDMVDKKSIKWSEMQSKEDKANFPLPFEIHITVDLNEQYDLNNNLSNGKKLFIEDFKKTCQTLGVKPIFLDLELNDISKINEVMTSSKHFGDNRTAFDESQRIKINLEKLGYKVNRVKIETVSWHPSAPVISNGKEIPNSNYFESHIPVLVDSYNKNDLYIFCENLDHNYATTYSGIGEPLTELSGIAKLSKSVFKKSKDDKEVIMLTYRSNKCGKIKFNIEVEGIKKLLEDEGFSIDKVEIEYAIYDTNISVDDKWLKI